MVIKVKKIKENVFKIVDCEDSTFKGKKIIIDRIKDFNKCIVSGYYEIDTAGNIWTVDCSRIVGVYEEIE